MTNCFTSPTDSLRPHTSSWRPRLLFLLPLYGGRSECRPRSRLNPLGGSREGPRATGGEPSPPLASAASRRVGPCTRSVVQRSCTGGPGAASASVTLGRRADSERSGPPPAPAARGITQYGIDPRVIRPPRDPGSGSALR